jgi:cullin-4
MVARLLVFKKGLDNICSRSFQTDETFVFSLRESYATFINDRKISLAWGTGNSKVGEMIAKYVDELLRNGLKGVPRVLEDTVGRTQQPDSSDVNMADDDAQLEKHLDQALELFRFIQGKDVFEAFYKKDLARRLLMSRSASQDAERYMLAKLKNGKLRDVVIFRTLTEASRMWCGFHS